MDTFEIVLYIIMTIIFDIVMAVCYFNSLKKINKLKKACTLAVTGQVVSTVSKKKMGYRYSTNTIIYPVFQYSYLGQTIQSEYAYGIMAGVNYKDRYDVGRNADIRINPNNPRQFYIPADKAPYTMSWAYPILALLVSGIMASIVFFMIIAAFLNAF